jgi:hypothetical protein
MKTINTWILSAILAMSLPTFAATTLTSDLSDLWWNNAESGWGVTITQQSEIAFLTFYIYGTDGKPMWVTGQASFAGANAQGALVFNGTIYQSSGPWFGTTFNPATVNTVAVGSMTLTALLDSATLSYSINGVTVNKSITRQTFRNNDLSGQYMGAIKRVQASCVTPFNNGEINIGVDLSVANNATAFQMVIRDTNGIICSYGGDYTQTGKFGRSSGTYTCSGGVVGSYDAFEIDGGIQGLTGRFVASDNFCASVTGLFGVMRK